jgi:hypothetical protein
MSDRPEETFTPYVLTPGFGVVMVEVAICTKCERQTLTIENGWKCPPYYKAARAAQMKRAGWVDRAYATTAEGAVLCVECAPVAAAFKCALCQKQRHGKPQDSYGDPAEHLCTPCFETVPAKVWAEKTDELYKEHRYDFE